MKYFYLFLLIFLAYSKHSIAGGISIRFQTGYNYYNMEQLHEMQKSVVNNIRNEVGIPVKIVESFPAYYSYQFQILFYLPKNFRLGGFFDYASTGGRVHYRDYSGKYSFDQIVTKKTLGTVAERLFPHKDNHLGFSLILKGFISFSDLNIRENLTIGEVTDGQDLDFVAISIGIEPALRYEINFSYITSGLEIGYRIGFSGFYHLEDYDDTYLLNDGKEISPEWNGFKISLSFGVHINYGK